LYALFYDLFYSQFQLNLRLHILSICSLQCEFIDVPAEDLAEKLKFYPEQIEQALKMIIKGPVASIVDRIMEDTEPDLR